MFHKPPGATRLTREGKELVKGLVTAFGFLRVHLAGLESLPVGQSTITQHHHPPSSAGTGAGRDLWGMAGWSAAAVAAPVLPSPSAMSPRWHQAVTHGSGKLS